MSGEGLSFGQFRFDFARRELMREGVPVRLGSRALDILSVLASAGGEIVTKDELLKRVWPGRIVEENNLQVQVSALRKALDEGKSGQSHLVTVPGRGYRLIGLTETPPGPAREDKPSIAVLPFRNMSNEPAQDYFADGMVEDIITALSRLRWLFVIARNSSFTYKGRAVDVKQVGRELGVRYVLEGSVRKAAQRVRITAQLIDASTGTHLWADSFDGGIEDIFDLQDQVAASVVGAMSPKLEQAEIERARRKPTENLDAYDYYLRALASAHRVTRKATDEALRLFARASALDPDFASPYGMASFCYAVRKINGWTTDRAHEVAETARLARLAADLGKDDAVALAFAGLALGYVVGNLEGAVAITDWALALNPNLAAAWYASGTVRAYRGGEPDVAIEHLARAMRLSPLDPFMFSMQLMTALSHFLAGRYAEAVAWAEKAFWERPNILATLRMTAVSYAFAGRLEEARKAVTRALELDPDMRISNVKDRIGVFGRAEDCAKFVDGLRQAGLPE
ncbi:MAG: winged helix-turn-helix domain-containing tetratricopeptide repeat protein [Hyphomicrobiaceae bacterium]